MMTSRQDVQNYVLQFTRKGIASMKCIPSGLDAERPFLAFGIF
jgi:hypothetical protein